MAETHYTKGFLNQHLDIDDITEAVAKEKMDSESDFEEKGYVALVRHEEYFIALCKDEHLLNSLVHIYAEKGYEYHDRNYLENGLCVVKIYTKFGIKKIDQEEEESLKRMAEAEFGSYNEECSRCRGGGCPQCEPSFFC